MMSSVSGTDLLEKQILLLKLTELMENRPDFGERRSLNPDALPRRWISKARGVVQRVGIIETSKFDIIVHSTARHWMGAVGNLQSHIYDIMEGLKVDLEIDGRAEVGTAYAPGDIYKFFADLKKIMKEAKDSIFLIDPYFNGEAFDDYLSDVPIEISIRIFLSKSPNDVVTFAKKHIAQYSSSIELRSSKKLHDRVMFIDNDDCWVIGGSIKDGGRKATYLIPMSPKISSDKLNIYEELWSGATQHPLI